MSSGVRSAVLADYAEVARSVGLDPLALSGNRSGRRQSIGESPLTIDLESLSVFQNR